MPQLVTAGAVLNCSFGMAPSVLSVLPQNNMLAGGPPAANIMDNLPMVNIAPFGMCQSLANPTVAAATAAAQGVLTPMPCVPVPAGPWAPGSPKMLVGGMPALNNTSICNCQWAGVISISSPGQTSTVIP